MIAKRACGPFLVICQQLMVKNGSARNRKCIRYSALTEQTMLSKQLGLGLGKNGKVPKD